jgi:hypothetical protein
MEDRTGLRRVDGMPTLVVLERRLADMDHAVLALARRQLASPDQLIDDDAVESEPAGYLGNTQKLVAHLHQGTPPRSEIWQVR